MADTDHVGMHVGREGRDALRLLAYRLTGATGSRVTMTTALVAVCSVANREFDATLAALADSTAKD